MAERWKCFCTLRVNAHQFTNRHKSLVRNINSRRSQKYVRLTKREDLTSIALWLIPTTWSHCTKLGYLLISPLSAPSFIRDCLATSIRENNFTNLPCKTQTYTDYCNTWITLCSSHLYFMLGGVNVIVVTFSLLTIWVVYFLGV